MKSKAFHWTARSIVALIALSATVALRAETKDKKFTGVFNAYSQQITTKAGLTGPYEVRGPWTIKLKKDGSKADFSAAVTMVFTDGWAMTLNAGNFDPTMRNAHTHHITLTDADVIWNLTGGFEITGTATVTLNGNPAPITVAPTPVVINVTGGTDVEFSNISLTFLPPGSSHFGTAPLNGVVHNAKEAKEAALPR
jgi:hypothetical protein